MEKVFEIRFLSHKLTGECLSKNMTFLMGGTRMTDKEF